MRLKLALLALAAAIGWSVSAGAITGDVPEFKKLADGVFAYIGKQNDANAMVIVTSEGVVLVDTGNNNPDSRALLKNIQAVTKEPVRYVVITQNHGDHIGGTPLFSPPAHVILQERVAKSWAAMKSYQINSWRKRFAERSDALKAVNPLDTVISFDSHMTLHLGGATSSCFMSTTSTIPATWRSGCPRKGCCTPPLRATRTATRTSVPTTAMARPQACSSSLRLTSR